MRQPNPEVVRNFRILIAVAAGMLFVLGLIMLAEGSIDTQKVRDQVQRIVKEKTGKDISIRGRVAVALLPTPTIYLPKVEIHNYETLVPEPSVTVDLVYLGVTLSSVFSDEPVITDITLERPQLQVIRAEDGIIHWEWLTAELARSLTGMLPESSVQSVDIVDGKVTYSNDVAGTSVAVERINASAALNDGPDINGSFAVYGHALKFSLSKNKDIAVSDAQATPIEAALYTNDKNKLEWKGGINFSTDTPSFSGNFTMSVEDMLTWLHIKTEEKRELFGQITGQASDAPAAAELYPLALSAKVTGQGLNLSLADVQLEGLSSKGSGSIALKVEDMLELDTSMKFSSLDYMKWKALTLKAVELQRKEEINAVKLYKGQEDQPTNPLPKDVRLGVDITSEKLLMGTQVWNNANLSAKLEDAALTIDQFSVSLPGDTTMFMFGIISESSAKTMRFEGSMETKGKSLRQLLTVLDESAADLPETGFEDFYVRSNVYVSSDQVRLSEADVKISDLHLSGGLVAYGDENTRLEADVKLKDINFDYFRDVWRKKQIEAGQKDFLQFDKGQSFNWLKKLHTTVDFKVSVERFTFFEREGSSASFRIFAREGEFGIYGMRFNYPGEVMEANLTFDVKGQRPFLNLLLNTAELNMNYFSLEPKKVEEKQDVLLTPMAQEAVADDEGIDKPPAPAQNIEELPNAAAPAAKTKPGVPSKKKWPEELIDMSWMDGINAALDISVGKLTIDDQHQIEKVKLRATLENNMLTMQGLSFAYWQGRCDINGSIYGGTVPGISLGFTLYDAEIKDVLQSLVGRDNISGRVSISGTIATSGVNYLSWVSQAEAKLVFTGRAVNVKNFNLQGVADAVQVSRTASDVFNNANLALVGGSTQMNIDGNLNVKNGTIRTPGITLKTGSITGNLTGEIKLVPWTMQLSSFYQFPGLTSETVPTMTVQLEGPITEPRMSTDTASLEAYVAKRIVGR